MIKRQSQFNENDNNPGGRAGKVLLHIAFAIFISACSTHPISQQMLSDQAVSSEKLEQTSLPSLLFFLPIGPGTVLTIPIGPYNSNKMREVICYNKTGQKVKLSVDRNTQLIIKDKKGETHQFYFDTVYVENKILYGLRSRILKLKREVPVDDIESAEIYSEFAKETSIE